MHDRFWAERLLRGHAARWFLGLSLVEKWSKAGISEEGQPLTLIVRRLCLRGSVDLNCSEFVAYLLWHEFGHRAFDGYKDHPGNRNTQGKSNKLAGPEHQRSSCTGPEPGNNPEAESLESKPMGQVERVAGGA